MDEFFKRPLTPPSPFIFGKSLCIFFFKLNAQRVLLKGKKSATYIRRLKMPPPPWNFSENSSILEASLSVKLSVLSNWPGFELPFNISGASDASSDKFGVYWNWTLTLGLAGCRRYKNLGQSQCPRQEETLLWAKPLSDILLPPTFYPRFFELNLIPDWVVPDITFWNETSSVTFSCSE